ncbi:hypothetical protein OAT07_01300 [Candidatus Pelagibacter sp.]|nr:hypothetical protein [Candidatus Pelagibacter sp.]
MIKKIILISILCCAIFSCGKKGDPVFEDIKKNAKIQSSFFNKI